jgi:hypothetical protein
MFHAVSAAFCTMIFFVVSFGQRAIVPGRRPTRGSGLGGDVDMSAAGAGEDEDDDDMAHAAANITPVASDADTSMRAGFT